MTHRDLWNKSVKSGVRARHVPERSKACAISISRQSAAGLLDLEFDRSIRARSLEGLFEFPL